MRTPASTASPARPAAEGEPPPQPPSGVLERGIAVLECFREDRLRLSLRDFAELTGLDKATLLRLLGVLVNARMVQRNDSGQYAPGPALLTMGMLYRSSFDLGTRLQPVLQAVMEQTGETVAFYVRSGNERVCLYREHGHNEVRPHVEPGMRLPLAAGGASAHILLHFSGGKTPHAAQIVSHGFAMTRAERVAEMASVALPVFDGDGSFAGALVVIGVGSRHNVDAQLMAVEVAREQLALQGFSSKAPPGWRP
ncbi:MAG TPA: IclR family transcriptional regulator [Ramlibacter sp.]|nr:IclR family transcriptional regulator [Ramlibacter sp.]